MKLESRVIDIINEDIRKTIELAGEEDTFVVKLLEKIEKDYKISQYLFLEWLKATYSSKKVCYAGSGSDFLPKYVFGEENVFHTSMEKYKQNESAYFPNLGSGIKIIADNCHKPFPTNSFDVVLFFGLSIETIADQLTESIRVLKKGGVIGFDNIVADGLNFDSIFSVLDNIEVPFRCQNRGLSETNFYLFKKNDFY